MKRHVILASASPRRKDLLEAAGYSVTCVVSGVEELEVDHLSPAALAMENARRKATAVAPLHPNEIVIAADTVVSMDGIFFGKPANEEAAVEMLRRLNGRKHEVVTGVVVSGCVSIEFSESTRVTFRTLTDEDLRDYVRDIHPLDKAGSYAAQNDNGRIIKGIEGSLSNVIGLPIERLEDELATAFS